MVPCPTQNVVGHTLVQAFYPYFSSLNVVPAYSYWVVRTTEQLSPKNLTKGRDHFDLLRSHCTTNSHLRQVTSIRPYRKGQLGLNIDKRHKETKTARKHSTQCGKHEFSIDVGVRAGHRNDARRSGTRRGRTFNTSGR